MKIVITAQGQDLSAEVDPRFGRAKYFIVAETDTGEIRAVDNVQNLNAAQGAGIQAGKTVTDLGVDAVISGHVGPKAFATLQSAGVKMYTGASGTVAEALEQFKAGRLAPAEGADVEGHWV
jgi:predicted Fe-Mo cluster-binding NifX family protein